MSKNPQSDVSRDLSSDVNGGYIVSPKVTGSMSSIQSEDRYPFNGSSVMVVERSPDTQHGNIRPNSLCLRAKCLTGVVPDLLPLNSCLWRDGNFKAIIFGVRVLFKYGVNLLKSKKPSGWRSIKKSNKAYVMYLKPLNGHDNVLVALGYTERNVDSFDFPKCCMKPNLKQVCKVTADLMLLQKELSFHFCNRIHFDTERSIVNISPINEELNHPKQDGERGSRLKKTQRLPRPKERSRSFNTYKTCTRRKPPVPSPRRSTRTSTLKAKNDRVDCQNTKVNDPAEGTPFGNAPRSFIKDDNQQQADSKPPVPSPRRLTRTSNSKGKNARVDCQNTKWNAPENAPHPFVKDDNQQQVDSKPFKYSSMMFQKPTRNSKGKYMPPGAQATSFVETSPTGNSKGKYIHQGAQATPLVGTKPTGNTKGKYMPPGAQATALVETTPTGNSKGKYIHQGAQAIPLVGTKPTGNTKGKYMPPGAQATALVETTPTGNSKGKYIHQGAQAIPLVGTKPTGNTKGKYMPPGAQATALVETTPTGNSKGKYIHQGAQAIPLVGTKPTGNTKGKYMPPGAQATELVETTPTGNSKGKYIHQGAQAIPLVGTKPTGNSKGKYMPPGAQATPLAGTKTTRSSKGKYIPPGAQATPLVEFHTSRLCQPSTKNGNQTFGFKMPSIDTESICQAYTDVRDDNTETSWALIKYAEDKSMVLHGIGTDYDEMLSNLQEDERAYGYVRLLVGDELSRRTKFALVTWIGPNVGALKKAAVSTDKATVKNVFQQFQVEVQADDIQELQKSELEALVRKAGGANYGTGSRD